MCIEMQEILQITSTSGIERKLDELGRIVIPKNYREGKVEDGETKVEIYQINDWVIIEILDKETKKFKKFDELGRVVIYIEIRNKLNWEEADPIEIWNYEKGFILKKVQKKCIFCNEKNNLLIYKEKLV